jgi:hypothetical protein
MYKIVPFTDDLDLSNFYYEASIRGFTNNSSKKSLVDCFINEREKQVFILYFNDIAIGSVGAHSFDDVMGKNSYRIAARTCVFTNYLDKDYNKALRTISVITKHQNPTAQFLIPACLNWVPENSKLYITSNESLVGTQRLVHKIFGPAMEKQNVMKRIKEVFYRGSIQTVWEFFPKEFLIQLNNNKRWQ